MVGVAWGDALARAKKKTNKKENVLSLLFKCLISLLNLFFFKYVYVVIKMLNFEYQLY